MEGRREPKIAFVGGGSYQWGPKIILDVALNEGLRGGTLVLHDINGAALEDMYEWGQKAIDLVDADLKLEKSLRLEEALRGAGLDGSRLDSAPPLTFEAATAACLAGVGGTPPN